MSIKEASDGRIQRWVGGCVADGSDESGGLEGVYFATPGLGTTDESAAAEVVDTLLSSPRGTEDRTDKSSAIEDSEFSTTATVDRTGQSALIIPKGLEPGAQPNEQSQATPVVVPALYGTQRCAP